MRIARLVLVVLAVALVTPYNNAGPAPRVTKPAALSPDDEAKLIEAIGQLHRAELRLVTDLARQRLDKTTVTSAVALASELTKLMDNQHDCDPGECIDPATGLCKACRPKQQH